MFEKTGIHGGTWIGQRQLIIRRYVSSPWFAVDLVSVFPFYVLGWAQDSGAAQVVANLSAADEAAPSAEPLASLRLVKLLRMLKLARMLKAAEYFMPKIQDLFVSGAFCARRAPAAPLPRPCRACRAPAAPATPAAGCRAALASALETCLSQPGPHHEACFLPPRRWSNSS